MLVVMRVLKAFEQRLPAMGDMEEMVDFLKMEGGVCVWGKGGGGGVWSPVLFRPKEVFLEQLW